jgi:hypothetical protein
LIAAVFCRVRDFEVMDIYPFGVQLSWEKDGEPTTSIVFELNGPLPSTKSLTFYRYTRQSSNTLRILEDPSLSGLVPHQDKNWLYDSASVAAKTRHLRNLSDLRVRFELAV